MSRIIYATWADPVYDVDHEVRGTLNGGSRPVGYMEPGEGFFVEDVEVEINGTWYDPEDLWGTAALEAIEERLLDANT